MRIALDARKLHDYGIGTYVRNILSELARQDGGHTYVLLCRAEDAEGLRAQSARFETIVVKARHYSLTEQVTMPLALRRARVDLFHAPHYVVSPLTPRPYVVTIHDCIHLRFPQYLPNRAAYAYARSVMTTAARRATRVLTVSNASKRDILSCLGVPNEKVEVIYNGLDTRLASAPDPEAVERVRDRYMLTSPFILYTGNIKPHKNVDR
ncbi:MAG TPA: glycosyltransferase, partial [Vicinamibacterales bacterium]|nr:glycosyltransferase [Vicinamibacterales bacterium]